MLAAGPIVFLLDVDNTLLDNDRFGADLGTKTALGNRLTTVFVRQGHYARDAETAVIEPPPEITIERIGDLLDHSRSDFLTAAVARAKTADQEPA